MGETLKSFQGGSGPRDKEEMIRFLQEQTVELDAFDDGLVRRLVEQVIVHEDGRFTVEFKSGTGIVLNYTKR